jgi:hypothetical protein
MAETQEAGGGKAAKTSTVVKMDPTPPFPQGRELEFVGKRRQLKEAIFNEQGEWTGTVMDFINGRSLYYKAPEMDFKLKNGNYALHQHAAHGSLQKFGDSTAGYKEDELDDAVLSAEETMQRVSEGEWAVEREGGGMAGTSVLILALVESTGKTYEQLKEWLKTKTKEQKDAMRNSDRLRPIVQRLEAERAAKSAHVDTSGLFSELDAAA